MIFCYTIFMTWALRRQIFYISILASFLLIYPKLNKAPTCYDNKQNGNETGVDCGGMCARACMAETDPISVLWSRSFKVVDGRYNAVAYLENHNKNTAVNKINYKFRFADSNNLYIGKRDGSTFIPPSGRFAIFEPAIDVGNSVPVYVSLEFTQVPDWIQVAKDKIDQAKVVVSDIKLEGEDTSPRLSATIKNNSFFIIPDIEVVVILYDALGNAVSTSQTYVEMLNAGESKVVNFTWPEAFTAPIVEKEVIPEFNIFSIRLK